MSVNWSGGYVADIAYTLGFYRELAPTFLNFVCVANGVNGLNFSRPIRYCELGCGRGYGTVLLAAANPDIEFVGIDFNPSHIAEARALASRADISNISFHEMSFGDAARSRDPKLAEFDVVVLHGVYAWIERQARDDIHQFIRDKLLAGGLVYNSYNTLPGWTTVAPIQRLIMEIAQRSSKRSVAVIDEAMALLNTLSEHSSAFVVQNPGLKGRLERMAKQDKTYLAHEFVNTGWEPLYITEAMASFGEAKCTYVGSASLAENRLDLCVPKNLHDIVLAAQDVGMRELLKDYAVNKQFRRDVYLKGPQQLSQREQRQRFGELSFAAMTMGADVPEKFQLPIGEISPKREAVKALFDVVSNKVATGDEIIAAGEKSGRRDHETLLLLLLLVNAGIVSPARPNHAKTDRAMSQRLNNTVMDMTASADSHRFLAAPVIGTAIGIPFVDRIVAPIAVQSKKLSDNEIAAKAFDRLDAAGQSFRRDGKPLTKTDENVKEIAKIVQEFRQNRLPRWRELGLVGKEA